MQEEVENRTLNAGCQRNKVHRQAAQSRISKYLAHRKEKEAAKAEKP